MPASHRISVMRNRPARPLPSRNGQRAGLGGSTAATCLDRLGHARQNKRGACHPPSHANFERSKPVTIRWWTMQDSNLQPSD